MCGVYSSCLHFLVTSPQGVPAVNCNRAGTVGPCGPQCFLVGVSVTEVGTETVDHVLRPAEQETLLKLTRTDQRIVISVAPGKALLPDLASAFLARPIGPHTLKLFEGETETH